MKKFLLCIFFSIVSVFVFGQNAEDSLYAYAKALVKMKKESQALITITKHLNAYPKDAKGYFLKGSIEFKMSNPLQAETDFGKAIEYKNNYFEAYFNRAAIRIGMNKIEEGKNDLSYILFQNQNIFMVWHERGKLYQKIGLLDSALHDYSQALVLKPELEEANALSSEIYFYQKNYKKAKECALKAYQINAHNEKTLTVLSDIAFLENEYSISLPYFAERLRLNPYDWNGYLMRAKIYFQQKNYTKAKEDLEKIVEKQNDIPEVYYYLAKIYHELKEEKKACEAIKKTIELKCEEEKCKEAKILEKKYCH